MLCVVFLLVPAVFLHFYLDSYLQEQLENSRDSAREKTRTELALLQKELDLEEVVKSACENFARQARSQTGENTLTPEICTQLEKLFKKRLPATSPLIWLNADDQFIATNAPEFAGGRKVWESISRIRNNRGSRIDQKIAENLVKTAISPNLDHNFFIRLSIQPTKIIFKGDRFLLCLIDIRNRQKQKLGSVFAFLPLFDRKPDWLARRAIARFKQKGLLVGIYKTSAAESVESSSISGNELNGFLSIFASGRNFHVQNDNVYSFSFLARQQDCFVCVGSPLHHKSIIRPQIIHLFKMAAFLPFIIALTTLIFFYENFLRLHISIKARFWLTTTALAILPTMVMIILGIMNSHLLRPEIDRQQIEKLRNQIDSVKEKAAYQLTVIESAISAETGNIAKQSEASDKLAQELAQKYKKLCCESVFVLCRNGEVFYATNLSDVKRNSQIRFIAGLMEFELKFFDFAYEVINKKYKSLIGSNSWGNLNRSFYYNQFISVEIGTNKNYLLARCFEDQNGKVQAIVALTFNKLNLNRQIFAEIFHKTRFADTRLFVVSLLAESINLRPASAKVNEILELAAFAHDEFVRKISFKNQSYLILGKHLENLNLAIVGVTRLKSETDDLYRMFTLTLLITLLLAASAANFSTQTLYNQLLKPIEKFSCAIEDMRNGILGNEVKIASRDEIYQLSLSFNKMSNGLKTKADMAKFLNKDLTSETFQTQSKATRKIFAVILFAGIRDFARLESRLSPEESFALMNSFLSTCESVITESNGQIDKFIGDTVMSFFQHEDRETAVRKAAFSALSLQDSLIRLNSDLPELKKFRFGIGIAAGTVISGAIGSRKNRLDYTLIGDPVNLAARLEKLAGKADRPSILIALEKETVWPEFLLEELKINNIKGKEKAVRVFSLTRSNA